ncbi:MULTISPECIES: serine/threonine protein kinase [unclassified Bradyrhizobium]|uniref:serine/threonine protein kinase n=1 Tax=unclassified Bradyrhizobium TaxID=2631580 RepID=UPI0029161C3B|nr:MULTISPECIES: protein kinase [unclassified Bradyrhizobium]
MNDYLGAGATAAVFEVEAGRELVALKIYDPKFLRGRVGQLVRKRFDLALKQLMGHDCPHLIKINDGGEVEDTIYMAMERAAGECLGNVLKQVRPAEIRSIVRQVAAAAKYLEDRKLCHRDIKSDNVVVSEDFKHATLLDLGVIRWLDDEGAGGSDQDGQLPFVATARYSPPEYMFRLVPPGPDLWRGLTFYQLGGLLHDLIMRERMFEDVVRKASENRYLIAHAVATDVPIIRSDGTVPIDLVVLGQRALEKNLTRRLASVNWTDFLDDDQSRQDEVVLGLRSGPVATQTPIHSTVAHWVRTVEDQLDKKLVEGSIHAAHQKRLISKTAAALDLRWCPANSGLSDGAEICVTIDFIDAGSFLEINGRGQLTTVDEVFELENRPVAATPLQDENDLHVASIVDQVRSSFIEISASLVRTYLRDAQ